MKDIHNHILYSVDDGCIDLEESILLIKNAIKNGYTDLVLTPHYRESQKYMASNIEKIKLFNLLKTELKNQDININLYLGNEITLDSDLFYYFETDQILTLNSSRYIMLELPFLKKYKNIKDIFIKLKKMGLVPIIVHPERCEAYRTLFTFKRWTKRGVLFQGNMDSLYGKYGLKAKKKLEKMLKYHLISFIGSDIHHNNQSSFDNIHDILKKLEELTDSKEMAFELVDGNILKVIQNKKIKPYKIYRKELVKIKKYIVKNVLKK